MKILCIGDSNTYGYDPRSYLGERYPEDVRWTGRLSGHDVINWGINGITIPRDASVYIDLIERKEPDLIIVMLGTNDILEGADARETSHRMEEFLDSISVTSKPILLIAPPHLQDGEWVETESQKEESSKLGASYRELAEKKGCRFADSGEWGIEISFDGVHFLPEGHRRFAEKLEEVLKTDE